MTPSISTAPAGVGRDNPGRIWSALTDWSLAMPLLGLVGLLLLAPALQLIVGSLTDDDGLTLAVWGRSLQNKNDRSALVTSLELGAVVATASLLVGAPLAWLLSRMPVVQRAGWLALLNVAANFSGIGLGFAFLATLGQVGMITLVVHAFGIAFDPPSPATFAGLILGYLYTNVPLFVLLTIPAMAAVRDDWWEAAQTASASRWLFWHTVGAPVLGPFLAAGWLLIFTWSVGLYGIAFALAGTGGVTDVRLLTLQIGLILQSSVFGQERAYVLAVELMIIASVSLIAYRVLVLRAARWIA